jgi:hypothetical protein
VLLLACDWGFTAWSLGTVGCLQGSFVAVGSAGMFAVNKEMRGTLALVALTDSHCRPHSSKWGKRESTRALFRKRSWEREIISEAGQAKNHDIDIVCKKEHQQDHALFLFSGKKTCCFTLTNIVRLASFVP